MNAKEFYLELGWIDEDFIQEAEIKTQKSTKPIHKIQLTKVSAAAWFLIIAFGIIPCSYLFLTNSTQQAPVPPLSSDNRIDSSLSSDSKTDSSLSSDSIIDSSELPDSYALILNEAKKGNSENKIYIPGHFWEELKEEELAVILPGISNSYPLSGTVNYRGDGTIFNLNIYADYLKNNTDSKIYIQISPDKIVLDQIFITEPILSEIMGIAVTAGYYKNQENTTYFASFTLDEISYYIQLSGGKAEKALFPAIIDEIISGGKADLSILAPANFTVREDTLTLEAAYKDPDFGMYLPKNLSSEFVFTSFRFVNQKENYLNTTWLMVKGSGSIHWNVSFINELSKERITSIADTKNYDLSLYSIPYTDSVPKELIKIVENPIFLIEELTLEAIKSRISQTEDSNNLLKIEMRFGVLCDNILIEIDSKGCTPEELFYNLEAFHSS